MPNRGSWNGRWSGEDKLYVVTRTFRGESIEKAKEILAKGYYHYSWDDGWGVGITVEEVDSKEAAKLRRKSAGFCGYDWMVKTIIEHGQPLASHEVPQ
jgi:hypothetical protein